MKKWEKEILQKQVKDEYLVLGRLKKSYGFAIDEVKNNVQVLMAREQTQSIIYQLKYQKELQKQLETIYGKMNSSWYSTVDEYLKDCYEDGFYQTMYGLHQEGIPLILPLNQEEAVQAAAQASDGIPLSKKIYQNTYKLATITREEVTRGIATNSSYADIARGLEKRGEATLNQAYRIVRTESHRIQEEVKFKTINKAKDKGADVVKQWDASIDRRTRPSHAALDGQLREIDQPFKSPTSGKTALYPGGFGIASEDINCRCTVLQRARWALDKSELDKYVGDLDGMTEEQLDSLADKMDVSKEELIKKSNGVINPDGSVNHTVKAQNYNQFKKKYQKKEDTLKNKLQSQIDVAEQEKSAILSKYNNDMGEFMINGDADDMNKFMGLNGKISDLQGQLGIHASTATKAVQTQKAPTAKAPTPKVTKQAVTDNDALMKNAKRFSSGSEADKYHKEKNFVQSRWDKQLTFDEQHGIKTYTSSAYRDMNNALRSGNLARSKYKYDIEQATSGLEKTLIAEDTVVFRGMGGADALSKWTGIPIDNLKDASVQQSLIGSKLTEKAFMSTGTNEGSAWGGIRLEVYLPKGSQAMYVDPISHFSGEYEILIQRNSTFEVERIDMDSNGYIKNIVLVLVEQLH